MWKQFTRRMAPAGADGGGGGGSGSGDGGGADGKGGQGGGDGKGGTILSGGANAAGGAGKGGEGGQGGDAGAGGGNAWLWNEGVPGTGDRPAWYKGDKYKSVAEQAAALPGLEAKLGPAAAFFGAPQDGKYSMPKMPEGVTGEWDMEAPLTKAFMDFAKKEGLSQAGVDKLAGFYAATMALENQQAEVQLSEALGKLGENVGARIEAIKTYVTAKLGAEGFAALDEALGTNVAAFQAFEKLVALQANDPRLAGSGGDPGLGFTKEDVLKEQFKVFEDGPLKGQKLYDHDQAHREKVDGMWKKLYPGDGHQFMGGA